MKPSQLREKKKKLDDRQFKAFNQRLTRISSNNQQRLQRLGKSATQKFHCTERPWPLEINDDKTTTKWEWSDLVKLESGERDNTSRASLSRQTELNKIKQKSKHEIWHIVAILSRDANY